MKKLFIIVTFLIFKSSLSLGAVGDVYKCEPLQLFKYAFGQGKLAEIEPKYFNEHRTRLVWMENSMSIRLEKYKNLGYEILFRIHSSSGDTEAFVAQERGNIANFYNGVLVIANVDPISRNANKYEKYKCKKI